VETFTQVCSHRPGNPARVEVVRWPSAGDTAGCRLRQPKLTPVSLISMVPAYREKRLDFVFVSVSEI